MTQIDRSRGIEGESKYPEKEESKNLAPNVKKAFLSFYHILAEVVIAFCLA